MRTSTELSPAEVTPMTRVPLACLLLLLPACVNPPPPHESVGPTQTVIIPNGVPLAAPLGLAEVAAGGETTCVRTHAGEVACFGASMAATTDQKGLHTAGPVRIPVPPAAQIAVGTGFACSRDVNGGQVHCWGNNRRGQLGRETPGTHDHRPLLVPGLTGVERLAALGATACARTGPTVMCWGATWERPTDVGLNVTVGDFMLGDDNGMVCQRSNSAVACTTRNDKTELPHSTWVGASQPTPPGSRHPMSTRGRCTADDGGTLRCGSVHQSLTMPGSDRITLGSGHVCGLSPTDRVWCVGDNRNGQLGVSGADAFGEPVWPSLPAVRSIAAGTAHTCAVTLDSELYCWGHAVHGQLSLPVLQASDRPMPIALDTEVQQVLASNDHTCIVSAGEMRCSGFAERDSCGTAAFTDPVSEISDPVRLVALDQTWCILEGDGELRCKIVDPSRASEPPHSFVVERKQVTDVVAHVDGWCMLADSRITCLRDRYEHPIVSPFRNTSDFVAIGGGDWLVCGARRRGGLLCRNTFHMWEDDSMVDPVQVPLANAAQIAAGSFDRIAIVTEQRQLRQWNIDPTSATRAPALALDEVMRVEVGQDLACARTRSGALWCWDPGVGDASPQRMLESVSEFAVGRSHACAIDESNTLQCWGNNEAGQLGNGHVLCAYEPRNVTAQVTATL